MPNNCVNRFLVWGPDEDIAKLKKLVINRKDKVDWWSGEKKANLFDFDRIIPQPPEVLKSLDETGNDLWYHWRYSNWDTKWNSYDPSPDIDEHDRYACYFLSAWGPPVAVYKELARKFPRCSIEVKYWIEGNDGGILNLYWSKALDKVKTRFRKRVNAKFEEEVIDRQVED